MIRLAYVTPYDARNVRAWSGAGHHIARALAEQGASVHYIGRVAQGYRRLLRARQFLFTRLGVPTLCDRVPSLVRAYAREIQTRLPPECGVILSPGSVAIAGLDSDRPIVFWSDATFAGMLDYYPEFSSLPAASIDQGNRVERDALERCTLAVYTSEWAAASAVRDYGADPEKIKVVPFGANTSVEHTPDEVDRMIGAREAGACKLLFVGSDWQRKGGDCAVRIAEDIRRQGTPVELHVVGCTPRGRLPEFVRVHGYLSKGSADGLAQFNRLFSGADFLVLPVRAECNANVFAEACSFAVPVLCTRTGGVTTSVKDGVNGMTFPYGCGPRPYADCIQELHADRAAYRRLALGAYHQYRTRLNWRAAAASVMQLMERCVSRHQPAGRSPAAADVSRCAASH